MEEIQHEREDETLPVAKEGEEGERTRGAEGRDGRDERDRVPDAGRELLPALLMPDLHVRSRCRQSP